jgi:hypothetical protein
VGVGEVVMEISALGEGQWTALEEMGSLGGGTFPGPPHFLSQWIPQDLAAWRL